MKRLSIIVALLFVSCCTPRDRIDKQKFERLYRAGKAIETFHSLKPDLELRRCLRELETECGAAGPLASTDDERAMVSQYSRGTFNLRMAVLNYEGANIGRFDANAQKQMGLAFGHWNQGLADISDAGAWYASGSASFSK